MVPGKRVRRRAATSKRVPTHHQVQVPTPPVRTGPIAFPGFHTMRLLRGHGLAEALNGFLNPRTGIREVL